MAAMLSLAERMNDAEMIDTVFFEFDPVAFFLFDRLRAALFFGKCIPGIEADALGEIAVGETDDEFLPKTFLAELIVALHEKRVFFKLIGDLMALFDFVEFDHSGVTGMQQVLENFIFEAVDGGHFVLERGVLIPLGDQGSEREQLDEGQDFGIVEAEVHFV